MNSDLNVRHCLAFFFTGLLHEMKMCANHKFIVLLFSNVSDTSVDLYISPYIVK